MVMILAQIIDILELETLIATLMVTVESIVDTDAKTRCSKL